MPFTRPNLSALRQQSRAIYAASLPGADSTLRRSNINVSADVMAGLCNGELGYMDYLALQPFASSCDYDHLLVQGQEYNLQPTGGTEASGNGIFSGTAGEDLPQGTLTQDSSGNEYQTLADSTIGDGGNVTVSIEALGVGSAQNLAPNAPLILVVALPGINANAQVDGNGLSGGADPQNVDLFRATVLARKQQPPQGGIGYDYVRWAKAAGAGVTRAWAVPLNRGPGTVDVAIVCDGQSPITPTTDQIDAAQAYINLHYENGNPVGRPVTDDCVVFAPTLTAVNFTITGLAVAQQAAVAAALTALMLTMTLGGGLSWQDQVIPAVAGGAGASGFTVTAPSTDIAGATNTLLTLGTITW